MIIFRHTSTVDYKNELKYILTSFYLHKKPKESMHEKSYLSISQNFINRTIAKKKKSEIKEKVAHFCYSLKILLFLYERNKNMTLAPYKVIFKGNRIYDKNNRIRKYPTR
jgi:hypothetical protein